MHELAVCQGLLDQLDELSLRHGGRTVRRAVVQVGPLSGVEPDLLANSFTLARRGCAAAAELCFEAAPLRVSCLDCGEASEAAANRLLCGRCGSHRTRLLGGDELLLRRVEFELEERPAHVH